MSDFQVVDLPVPKRGFRGKWELRAKAMQEHLGKAILIEHKTLDEARLTANSAGPSIRRYVDMNKFSCHQCIDGPSLFLWLEQK